jgi:hypothetical protein
MYKRIPDLKEIFGEDKYNKNIALAVESKFYGTSLGEYSKEDLLFIITEVANTWEFMDEQKKTQKRLSERMNLTVAELMEKSRKRNKIRFTGKDIIK